MRVKGEGGGGMERRGIGSGDTHSKLVGMRENLRPSLFPICVTISNLFIELNQLLLPLFMR